MARVALYAGGGAPYHHAGVLAAYGHDVDFVFPDEIRTGALDGFAALVMPGGGYRAMIGQLEPLGSGGAQAITDFVRAGGMYVGSCAGSYCAARVGPAFTRACPVKEDLDLLDARVWNEEDDDAFGLRSPGVGVLRLRTVAGEHPVMRGLPERFPIVHYNGPLFTGAEALAVVDGREAAFTEGRRLLHPDAEDDLIERAVAESVAAVVAGTCGDGRVVLFGSHPEFGTRPAMDDELGAVRMLLNAIDWQAEVGPKPGLRPALIADQPDDDHEGAVADVRARAAAVRAATARIAALGSSPWLERRRAISIFGRTPAEVLAGALVDVDRLASEVEALAPAVPAAALRFRAPVGLDGGYTGVADLLDTALVQLDTAAERWAEPPSGQPPVQAYAEMRESPYDLVAASYLAAVGTVAAAALLCRARAARSFA